MCLHGKVSLPPKLCAAFSFLERTFSLGHRHTKLDKAASLMFALAWSALPCLVQCLGQPQHHAQALHGDCCRLAEALKTSNATYFEKCVNWLLTMSEAVLSAYTHAMDTCQAAAPQAALKQDYERARNGYLQALLVIAADLGDL